MTKRTANRIVLYGVATVENNNAEDVRINALQESNKSEEPTPRCRIQSLEVYGFLTTTLYPNLHIYGINSRESM